VSNGVSHSVNNGTLRPTTQALWQQAQALTQQFEPAITVTVDEVQGSTPREVGTRMLVSRTQAWGTIGGGHLEWQAVALAQRTLQDGQHTDRALHPWTKRYPLGPTLGQCCGGVVQLRFEPLTPDALAAWPRPQPRLQVDLHGAGHVGQAIIKLLSDLDVHARWIDQRLPEDAQGQPYQDQATLGLPSGEQLAALPVHIECIPTEDATAEAAQAPWGRQHLVITHRHDLDLAIVDALLRRKDVQSGQAWVGMIGSQTKRAAFEHRLQERGHTPQAIAMLHCPLGLPGVRGKEPAVIAIAVLAQLLGLSTSDTMTKSCNSPG
jgi:xanthine dehydrogenase accessory factor